MCKRPTAASTRSSWTATFGGSGTYPLTLAQAPAAFVTSAGDQGGTLTNGVANPGTIDLGDLDMWSFTAKAGDSLLLRMGTPDFVPQIRLFGTNGALVADAFTVSGNSRDAQLLVQATNSGIYTVVVDSYFFGGSGTYTLTLAQAPAAFVTSAGDQGGTLTNGVATPGTIDLGDLDMWSFTANAGDSLLLRMGTPDFVPEIRLFGPDGALVADAFTASGNSRDAQLLVQATNSGIYTVVVDSYFFGGSGTYTLTLAQTPDAFVTSAGDQGGTLTNGVVTPGTIDLGDLDMWSITANAGDSLLLRMGTPDFVPQIRLFGPNGALVADAFTVSGNSRDAQLLVQATNSGIYTVVVDSYFFGGSGTYTLTLAQSPGAFVTSAGDEGGPLINGFTHSGTNSLGDLDMWSFYGTPGDSNVLVVATVDFVPRIQLFGPDGTLVRDVFTVNGNNRSATLTYMVTNAGDYTVVVSSYFFGGSGTYTLHYSRVPPDLTVPDTQIIDESTILNVGISAQDPDVPLKALVFALLSAPSAVTLTSAGNRTNATISWATTEADGPSTNLIVATVTDNVNGHAFIRTNSFTVIVREINTPPQLTVPADQAIDELTPLINVKASATDADLPPNPLTFSLIAPPQGMTIDTNTGAISWTPTEAQGPSINTITVVVTDDSPSAANAQHLSATNSFTVTVREVNLPPQLTVPGNQVIDELKPLNVAASATDPDLPQNTLTFSLLTSPPGMIIDSATGAVSWTPTEAQGPSTNVVTVKVQDNGSPVLSATNTFTVVVNEVNSAPVLPAQTNRAIDELTTLTVTNTATDADIPANLLTYVLLLGAPTNAAISANGVITWTPTEAQGPSTNTFTTVVTDNGTPTVSATNSFTVVVNEVNSAPVLPTQNNLVIDELNTLIVTNTATDADLPANTLTYALLAAPTNAAISADGVITWTPTEAQGPSTNTFTTVVTDNGSPSLSATNTFTVVVNEVNIAPVLQPIADQTVHFGNLLSLQAVATDADLPSNTLTFSLDLAPTNLTINATNGSISWTPSQAQVGAHPVTIRVTDNGSPSLSATNTFQVTVVGEGSRLDIQRLASGLMQLTITGDTGHSYELQKSTYLEIWDKLFEFQLSTSPFPYVDLGAETNALRFYRLKLIQ